MKPSVDLLAIASAVEATYKVADDIRPVMKEQARRDVEVDDWAEACETWRQAQEHLLTALVQAGVPLDLDSLRDMPWGSIPRPALNFGVSLDPHTGEWI